MAKAVKLADIAEQLGVSTVTVSKALSGQKGVSEAMREKIKQLADELGYKQPSAVKKEKSAKSYNIGVLVSEKYLGEYASFYWRMYQSVATRAVQKECFTMLEVVSLEDEAEANLPKEGRWSDSDRTAEDRIFRCIKTEYADPDRIS